METTIIKCTTGPHSGGVFDVVVSPQAGGQYTYNNGFTYDDSVQPRITNINPTQGPTYGGIVLTITGTSFPDVSEEVTISMGVRRCEVQTASSTEITCVVPNNPPGEVDVVVDTQTKGENFRGGIPGFV